MIDRNYPLIDLHRHLDGSTRLETILEVGLRYQLPLPATELETLRPHVQVTDPRPGVMAFLEKFKWMTGILVNYDICRRVAFENMEDASQEGIDYIELRFSPWFMAAPHQLDPAGVVEAVADGVDQGKAKFGVQANLIGIISRHYGPETAWKELNSLLTHRRRLIGLDLAGDEANWPGELFVDHFKKARDAGLHITVHAGESAGPESIWQALRSLGAERIGHGVSAVEDPDLMGYLADQQIGIESNLTSNVQTSTVDDYSSHPLRVFLERGLLATINTDDPGISRIDLPSEYQAASTGVHLTERQIQQAQKNALTVAFLTGEEKLALLTKKQSPAGVNAHSQI